MKTAKTIITVLMLFMAMGKAHAQRFKAMIQQIAAMEVYKGYVKTGYKIVDGGLKTIGSIKNGDFSLHNIFFKALKAVNPKLKQYPRIVQCMETQLQIVKACAGMIGKMRESRMFSAEELILAEKVVEKVLGDCALLLEELTLLVTDGQVQLKDDERIEKINGIYAAMEKNAAFVHSFTSAAMSLGTGRSKEMHEILRIQQYYGIGEN